MVSLLLATKRVGIVSGIVEDSDTVTRTVDYSIKRASCTFGFFHRRERYEEGTKLIGILSSVLKPISAIEVNKVVN